MNNSIYLQKKLGQLLLPKNNKIKKASKKYYWLEIQVSDDIFDCKRKRFETYEARKKVIDEYLKTGLYTTSVLTNTSADVVCIDKKIVYDENVDLTTELCEDF